MGRLLVKLDCVVITCFSSQILCCLISELPALTVDFLNVNGLLINNVFASLKFVSGDSQYHMFVHQSQQLYQLRIPLQVQGLLIILLPYYSSATQRLYIINNPFKVGSSEKNQFNPKLQTCNNYE